MKNKTAIIILYVALGIPVPTSVISWLGSLISLANIRAMSSELAAAFAVITMLLAGTYVITYAVSLSTTIKKQKLNIYSFMPVIHIALTVLFSCLWSYADKL